ncbi:MAG: TraR/DksA C4-type zinc finger protein [Pseudomonadota bacterium]
MAAPSENVSRAPHPTDSSGVSGASVGSGVSMSQEQLLAMPESAYMNAQQLAFFRGRLLRLRAQTLESPNMAGTGFLHEEPLTVPDAVDRATVEEEHAAELDARERNEAFLEKIQEAIARIDSAEYGFCEETGEPIGLRRLLARPTARFTLEAQERREQRRKMTGL